MAEKRDYSLCIDCKVSDHLSTRFFIKDNEEDKYYDVKISR